MSQFFNVALGFVILIEISRFFMRKKMVGSATRFTLFFAPWPMCWDQSVPSVVLVCDSNDNINHCFLIRELSTYINPTGSALRVSLFFAPWPTDQSVVSAFAGTNYILSLNCVSVFGQSTTNKWRRPGPAIPNLR